MKLNEEYLKHIIGPLHLEEVGTWIGSAKKYNLFSDFYGNIVGDSPFLKIGNLKIKSKPSGSDHYSGCKYHGESFLNLGQGKHKIVCEIIKEELAEDKVKIRGFVIENGSWVSGKESTISRLLEVDGLFN